MAKAIRRIPAHAVESDATRVSLSEATVIGVFSIGITICTLIVLACYAGLPSAFHF
jgi:hypothetical protein